MSVRPQVNPLGHSRGRGVRTSPGDPGSPWRNTRVRVTFTVRHINPVRLAYGAHAGTYPMLDRSAHSCPHALTCSPSSP